MYITQTLSFINDGDMQMIQDLYSKKLVDKIKYATSTTYQHRRITSRLMLVKIFEQLGISRDELKTISYSTTGALIGPAGFNICFSYTNNQTACLISTEAIGMDMECTAVEPKAQHLSLLAQITGEPVEDTLNYYRIWTRLESITKLYKNQSLSTIIYGSILKREHFVKQYQLKDNYLLSLAHASYYQTLDQINYINIF